MSAEHEPKLAALLALDAGVLSSDGRRRIHAHLEGCAICREALQVVGDYAQLQAEVQALPTPEVDFASMELPLRREARRIADASSTSSGPMLAAVAIAAAVLLGVWLRGGVQPDASGTLAAGPQRPQPSAAPVTAALEASLTAIAGKAQLDGATATLAGRVTTGAILETAAGGTLHVRLSSGTGVVLGPDSRLVLEEAREGAITLQLARGSVDCKVSKLSTGEHFVVRTGDTRVSVRGTHFRVVAAEQPSVDLVEGHVEIAVAGTPVADITAPARWPASPGGEALADSGAQTYAPPILPTGLGDANPEWAQLTLPPMKDVASWHVLGSRFGAAGPLALRAPIGELTITAELGDGTRVEAVWRMKAEGLELSERELGKQLRLRAERAVTGHLETSQIMPVVQAGTRQLQRCYEQALKNDASLRPRLNLRITVDPRGRVARSKMLGDAPADFARCVRNVAAGFRFPSPGGGSVTFDAPLRFKQRQ